jgi:hypothetical protein
MYTLRSSDFIEEEGMGIATRFLKQILIYKEKYEKNRERERERERE